ncbi:uncharacterized protein LOC125957841 [Anopheles darlingi]|uniref:uncharacterized protein LOC125957841 n=1 Tax=Anopheles darlingi TaxID=43151 RepID=UPI0021002C3F|nr:uncharacterized protein LOC125957841 [Anopheles darlingi]
MSEQSEDYEALIRTLREEIDAVQKKLKQTEEERDKALKILIETWRTETPRYKQLRSAYVELQQRLIQTEENYFIVDREAFARTQSSACLVQLESVQSNLQHPVEDQSGPEQPEADQSNPEQSNLIPFRIKFPIKSFTELTTINDLANDINFRALVIKEFQKKYPHQKNNSKVCTAIIDSYITRLLISYCGFKRLSKEATVLLGDYKNVILLFFEIANSFTDTITHEKVNLFFNNLVRDKKQRLQHKTTFVDEMIIEFTARTN